MCQNKNFATKNLTNKTFLLQTKCPLRKQNECYEKYAVEINYV